MTYETAQAIKTECNTLHDIARTMCGTQGRALRDTADRIWSQVEEQK